MTEGSGNIKPILETIAGVLAPITVITGLLYYFGWVRTAAIFSHFGVDQRILAYSIEDYLLRSAGVAFRPLAFVLIGVATSLQFGTALNTSPTGLVAFGLSLYSYSLSPPDYSPMASPFCLACSRYGSHYGRRSRSPWV